GSRSSLERHAQRQRKKAAPTAVTYSAVSTCPARTGRENATAENARVRPVIRRRRATALRQTMGNQRDVSAIGQPATADRKPQKEKTIAPARAAAGVAPIARSRARVRAPARNRRKGNPMAQARGVGSARYRRLSG